MTINIGGVVSVALFYGIILAVGIWVGWKQKRRSTLVTENIMLAGRDIGLFVGVLTMTATWVAGGYINGTAEGAFTGGFLRCSPVPIGFTISLLIGGRFFAKPMRDRGYVTMLDPFQEKYGSRIGGLLFIPALCGEIFWSAATLSALGSIFTVMLDMDNTLAIIVSAAVAVTYTMFGGLYSVAYTDVIQLICVFFGLVFCIPFVWNHPAIDKEAMTQIDWIGSVNISSIGIYIDTYLLIILGGIPWQVYFQRVLACRSSEHAQKLSYVAAAGCLLMAFPPALLGSLARAADWANSTDYGKAITKEDYKSILPLILQYLTPKWVSFIGLGAVSAAVMSSADSSVLSSSSMFVHNIYKAVWFPSASDRHLVYVMWISIVASAVLGSLMAITINTIFGLSYLCADIVYVVLFPQLLLVIYANDQSNAYGSLTSFGLGFLLRVLSGEELLNLPAVIHFPYFQDGHQLFPFRTFIMLTSIVTQLSVSFLFKNAFVSGWLPNHWDCLGCFLDTTANKINSKLPCSKDEVDEDDEEATF